MSGANGLIERAAAEQELSAALAGARSGAGAAHFVVGSPGLGKTSLLRRVRELATAEDFAVAAAVAAPMERGLPFGVLGQAIVGLGGRPVEDVADLARAGGQSARFYRTLQLVAELAAERPVLIALDDLHWADPDSLELTGFLARRIQGLRVLILGTLRSEPPAARLLAGELERAGMARVTTIEPLSREGAAEMIERLLGHPLERSESAELWRACGGTPLLLEAAARALRDGTPLRRLRGGAIGDLGLLLRRFADVDGAGFEYVKAAAILGVHYDHATAAQLAEVSAASADAALVSLVRAGVLADEGAGAVAFVHPLFAQAVLDAQPSGVRRRRHAAAFSLIVARHGSYALAAEHAALAGLTGDPLAVEVTARAGGAALAQGALRAAATHLENALALAGEHAPVDLVLLRGQALVAQADVEAARALCTGLIVRDLDAATRSQVLRLLARVELLAARPALAKDLFMQAAATAPDAGAVVDVLCDALLTCLGSAPAQWVLETARRALALAPEAAPAHRLLRFIEGYAALICECDPDAAVGLTKELIRAGARSVWPDQGWNLTLAVHGLNMCKVLEDFGGAQAIFEREYDEAVRAGAPVLMSGLAVAWADVLLRLGRLEEALELVERTTALIERRIRPWTDLAAAVLCSELGLGERMRGHVAALEEFRREMPDEEYSVVSLWLALLEAREHSAAGRHAQASDAMLRAGEIAVLAGRLEPCLVPWAATAIEVHLAAERPQAARALLGELERHAAGLPSRWPAAVATLGHAGLAASAGDRARADELYAEAIARFEAIGQPLELAQALVAHGTHLRRSGRPREAREPLARAVAICEEACAERLARIARAELAASGGRRRRRSEDPSTLTAQEARVASLAADGMTNGQIAAALRLSPRTVGFHLQRVYQKLDIHSRRELIRRAGQLDGRPPARREPAARG